jgi:hypothetical protein
MLQPPDEWSLAGLSNGSPEGRLELYKCNFPRNLDKTPLFQLVLWLLSACIAETAIWH